MTLLDGDPIEFLGTYILLLTLAAPAAFILPRIFRPAGRTQRLRDPDSLAWLGGGATRFTDTVASRLVASGAIEVEGKGFHSRGGAGTSTADRAVLALHSPFGWNQIAAALRPEGIALQRRLVSAGLLLDEGERRNRRLIAIAPFAAVLLLGVLRLLAEVARDGPLFVLSVIMVLTLIPTAIRWRFVSDKTRAACAALKEARHEHQRLRRAPTAAEADLAVALFGTSVLAGSAFQALHELRNPHNSSESSSSSGSCGSSCGGDSGCGSGCGGGGD